ncbi:DUF3784 domain-containing protein [uncultured Catenibacterium sp.]|uniref:DUF3784 domain-containing protein n=2 Tax=uncultured Catenibacterium sp. TaxID=286142 RepID=UPI0025DCEC2B|nr:DUF3784 domain-containing protein [uncultured Catenibacterium sp.]
MQIPLLLCAILFIVISISLYFGKGLNMIAGYNDLSQGDKEKINKIRLCRMLAVTLDITAIILILGAYSIISINDTMILGVILLIVGAVLSNVVSKNKSRIASRNWK